MIKNMKYWKNLIKREKILVLLINVIFVFLGASCFTLTLLKYK